MHLYDKPIHWWKLLWLDISASLCTQELWSVCSHIITIYQLVHPFNLLAFNLGDFLLLPCCCSYWQWMEATHPSSIQMLPPGYPFKNLLNMACRYEVQTTLFTTHCSKLGKQTKHFKKKILPRFKELTHIWQILFFFF